MSERHMNIVSINRLPYFMDLTGTNNNDEVITKAAMGIPARVQYGTGEDWIEFGDTEELTVTISVHDLARCILLANEHPQFGPILQEEILKALQSTMEG